MTENELSGLWDEIITILRESNFTNNLDNWLKKINPIELARNTLFIKAPESYSKEWLTNKYLTSIQAALCQIAGKNMQVKFILEEEIPEEIYQIAQNSEYNDQYVNLNPKYTFDSFVVGTSNRFAYAAALAVAEAPSKTYNPFFIYGGVGLGKTHLMHAVAWHIQGRNKNCRIAYATSEKFTTDLINSIRDKKQEEFRNKYRKMDILLIDDIQFLAGKDSTQEEFFHTFNSLYEDNKQIIISSDRPPKEIPTLEDRLRSRFEWGLITDVQPPDLETRVAILRKRVITENLNIDEPILDYIAMHIQSNIRELEGALTRLIAYSSINGSNITLEMTKNVLNNVFPGKTENTVSIKLIHQAVCAYFELGFEDLIAKKRTKNVAFPRQIAMYLARELTNLSLPQIGKYFGGRDHTTVLHENKDLEYHLKKVIHRLQV
ncbi:MAG: chromosomal replication initiator protein DnaA [Clostridia bacterium]|nr:chromosomal replication initiator protein DnaA [Clostridia bacterium]